MLGFALLGIEISRAGGSGLGPTLVLVDGVPVGEAHTPAGALAAADNYLALSSQTLEQDPRAFAALVSEAYAPQVRASTLAEAQRLREGDVSDIAAYRRAPARSRSSPHVAWTPTPPRQATITSWLAGFLWGPHTPPRQSWNLVDTTLRWQSGRWLVDSQDVDATPAPVPARVYLTAGNDRYEAFARLEGMSRPLLRRPRAMSRPTRIVAAGAVALSLSLAWPGHAGALAPPVGTQAGRLARVAPVSAHAATAAACGVDAPVAGALVEHLTGGVRCCGAAAGAVGGLVSEAAGAVGDGILDLLARWIIAAATQVTTVVSRAMAKTSTPQLESSWFEAQFTPMADLGAALGLLVALIALSSAAIRRSPQALAATLAGIVRAGLGTGLIVALTTTGLSLADQVSADVVSGSPHAFWATVAHAWGGEGFGGFGSSALAMLIALIEVFAAIFVWLELIVRAAAIYVAVLFFPASLAAAIWPALAAWPARLGRLLLLFVILKPVALIVLSLAGNAAAAGLSLQTGLPGSVGDILAATVIYALAAFAPWALMYLLAADAESAYAAAGARAAGATAVLASDRPSLRSVGGLRDSADAGRLCRPRRSKKGTRPGLRWRGRPLRGRFRRRWHWRLARGCAGRGGTTRQRRGGRRRERGSGRGCGQSRRLERASATSASRARALPRADQPRASALRLTAMMRASRAWTRRQAAGGSCSCRSGGATPAARGRRTCPRPIAIRAARRGSDPPAATRHVFAPKTPSATSRWASAPTASRRILPGASCSACASRSSRGSCSPACSRWPHCTSAGSARSRSRWP